MTTIAEGSAHTPYGIPDFRPGGEGVNARGETYEELMLRLRLEDEAERSMGGAR